MATINRTFNGNRPIILNYDFNANTNNTLELVEVFPDPKIILNILKLKITTQNLGWVSLTTYFLDVEFNGIKKECLITSFDDSSDLNISWTCFFECDEITVFGLDILDRCCPRNSFKG